MVLCTIGPRARESTLQHAQPTHLVDIELLPAVLRTALAFAANLKAEQGLDATSDAVVVWFDDSSSSNSIDELDETLLGNSVHKIVIHRLTTSHEGPFRVVMFPAESGEMTATAANLDGSRVLRSQEGKFEAPDLGKLPGTERPARLKL
jgi:hypothetical protein